MPLLDHFHPPLSPRRSWEGFHGLWAAALVEHLNGAILGEEYFADLQVHVGGPVQGEVDVAALEEAAANGRRDGGTATATAPAWAPPAAAAVLPTVFPDEVEVQVYTTAAGMNLVAAVELVSPGNKDRAETRRAFVAKCGSYLARGIGLVVVDTVTNRLANLHNDLLTWLGHPAVTAFPAEVWAYATAYRPARRPGGDQVELWPFPLAVGQPLPVVPLALRGAATVPLDLGTTYQEARTRARLG